MVELLASEARQVAEAGMVMERVAVATMTAVVVRVAVAASWVVAQVAAR